MYDQRFQQLTSGLFAEIASCAVTNTLSAHSFNFVVTVPGGQHTINATWSLSGVDTSGSASVAACTGPGTLTVTQTQLFKNGGAILVQ